MLDTAGIQVQVVARERLIAVLPKRHPLARARTVRLQDLADEQFMVFPADKAPSVHAKVYLACQEAGIRPRIVLETWHMSSMVSLVAAGVGIALLPAQVRGLAHAGAVYKDLGNRSKNLTLEIAAGWRADNASPALRSFLSVLNRKPLRRSVA